MDPTRDGPRSLKERAWAFIDDEFTILGGKLSPDLIFWTFVAVLACDVVGNVLISGTESYDAGSYVIIAGGILQLVYAGENRAQRLFTQQVDTSVDKPLLTAHVYLAERIRSALQEAVQMSQCSAKDRHSLFAKLTQSLVSDLVWLPLRGSEERVDGVRAAIYRLSDDRACMTMLAWDKSSPRNEPGRFVSGTDRGDKALDWVINDGQTVYVPDIRSADSERWAGTGGDYDSFISVRIQAGSKVYGMLTLDTAVVDDLSESHVALVELAASSLALVFAADGQQ